MSNTVNLKVLVDTLQDQAVARFKEASHPPEQYFRPQILQDIRAQANLSGNLMDKVTLEAAKNLLNQFEGVGKQTSVDMHSLASHVLESLNRSDSKLGRMFGVVTSEKKAPLISKANFIANIPDAIKAEGYEYDLFEAALPEQIFGADDINQAISDALGADYYGLIEDTIDVLKSVEPKKDSMALTL